MSRSINLMIGDKVIVRCVQDAREEFMPGVIWGDPWTLFTPAYWLTQAWMAELDTKPVSRYRARDGVLGEIVFCLLGGYGITAELATAAYQRCRDAGLIDAKETRTDAWLSVLKSPLAVKDHTVHYRFPNQKSKFLAAAMSKICNEGLRLSSGRALRDQLLELPGVGYKTSSWVARNVLDCDDVAILDIHIIRAGRLCGLYSESDRVERDYLKMESRYLEFCRALQLRPAALDCLMWDGMREAGETPIRLLEQMKTPGPSSRRSKKPMPSQLLLEV